MANVRSSRFVCYHRANAEDEIGCYAEEGVPEERLLRHKGELS
jgi:hypothetical protein